MGSRTLWVLVLEFLGTGVSPVLIPAFPGNSKGPGFSALGSSLEGTLECCCLQPQLSQLELGFCRDFSEMTQVRWCLL